MMESSEQCAYDGSMDQDDSSSGTERIVVTRYEDYAREVMPLNQGEDEQGNEEVLGYIDPENATLVLQSQGLDLDGRRLILAQGTGGDEIIFLVSSEQDACIEDSLEQSISVNSDDNHSLAIQYESNNLEVVSSEGTQEIEVVEINDDLQNIDKEGAAYDKQEHELVYVDSHNSSEALNYHVQEKDTTEMVFIPTTPETISTGNNTKLLHLADVAHSEWATSELHVKEDIESTKIKSEGFVIVSQTHSDSHSNKEEDASNSSADQLDNNNSSELHVKKEIMYTRKINEGSVIVSQMCTDSDSHSFKVKDAGIGSVNEQENNSLHDEHMTSEVETSPAVKQNSTVLSPPSRDVDNADSDSHSFNVKDAGISSVNEQDNSLHDEHMTSEIETSPVVKQNSTVLSSSSRDIDNAVSVIHVTSSTLVHEQDWRTKNMQENENQIEETDQQDAVVPSVPLNVTNSECSNLKETLDSELSSQSFLIEEYSIHSILKDSSDSSNRDDYTNYEIPATVEEPMEEDNNESIPFLPQLPSNDNIDEGDSKQKDSTSYNDNDSNTSMDVALSQNLDSKISDPSSKNCENEMEFTNSKEACSENKDYPERTFPPLKNNSESKNSFFSDDSQSKDSNLHTLKKVKSIIPQKVKKVIDEYEFENSSSNLDQELSHNSCMDDQPSDIINSDNISTEIDAHKISQSVNTNVEDMTGNLTFQGALTPVIDNTKVKENLTDGKSNETSNDNSQDLFDLVSQDEEYSSSKILKNKNVKFFKNKRNLAPININHTDEDKKSDEKILVEKNMDIDNKSNENDNVVLNATSDETTVKPPQRTYVRKRKTSESNRNIELFSLDDLSDPKDKTSSYLTPKIFCSNDQNVHVMNDENNLADEDGYVNLLPSDMKNIIKAKGAPPLVDERRTRSLRPRSSDHEKTPDAIMDTEDSVSTCWGAYLMETSFKPTNAEKTKGDAPKTSSSDVKKVESPKSPLKKRVRNPSCKKNSAKTDSYKSGEQWDKLINSSPSKMKNAFSDEKKIREKVKRQVEKTLRNAKIFNSAPILMPRNKKGRPSKSDKNKIITEKVKSCGFRFLNDNSIEKEDSSAFDDLSIPSTSTQDLRSFQYNCSYCNFVSNKVNNLIIHLKYCSLKPSSDMIDYRVNDMERRQRIRGDFTESNSAVEKSSTSQNFSNGSVIEDDGDKLECLNPPQEVLSKKNGEESEKVDEHDKDKEEPRKNSKTNKQKFGYRENAIVWATINSRFWPALVHKIDDDKFVIYFIDYPSKKKSTVTNVCMHVSIDSLSKKLHSYDDVKWNKKLLEEAEKLPYNDIFVKAVQKSDSYARREFVYENNLDGIDYFKIEANVELMKDTSEESRKRNNKSAEFVEIKDLLECIYDGHCNEHVIDIYNETIYSRRHELHSQKNVDKDAGNQLKHMSWFGPFKRNSLMRKRLHDYFNDLFKSNFGPRKDLVSYIDKVWIPEGIIKGISIVKQITLLEAQIIFYKQDMTHVAGEDFQMGDEDS